jgi:hypothetical protein
MVVTIKNAVIWGVTPCKLIEILLPPFKESTPSIFNKPCDVTSQKSVFLREYNT